MDKVTFSEYVRSSNVCIGFILHDTCIDVYYIGFILHDTCIDVYNIVI